MNRKIILLLIGMLWVFVGCQSEPSNATESPAATATPDGSLTGTVGAEGNIVPQAYAHLSFQSSGTVTGVLVAEGDIVIVGQPLVQLNTIDQENGLAEAETAVLQAKAALEAANTGLLAARTNVDVAYLDKRAAEANLALLQAGASPAQLALQEEVVAAANAAVIQATGQQAYALEPATSASIQTAEANLAAAESAALAARITRDTAPDNTSDDDMAILQNELNAAIANQESAQDSLTLLQAGATSSEQLAANSGVASAAYTRDAAAADLAVMQYGTRQQTLSIAQIQVDQAQMAIMAAEQAVEQAETAVAQAEANLTQAKAARDIAQTALDKRTLTAPIAGTVVDLSINPSDEVDLGVNTGDFVTAGVPIVTIADLSGWQIETTDLKEQNVVNLAPGLPVQVTLDAFPGAKFDGIVSEVAYASQTLFDDTVYQVMIDLDGVELPIRWGMTAFVEVDTGER